MSNQCSHYQSSSLFHGKSCFTKRILFPINPALINWGRISIRKIRRSTIYTKMVFLFSIIIWNLSNGSIYFLFAMITKWDTVVYCTVGHVGDWGIFTGRLFAFLLIIKSLVTYRNANVRYAHNFWLKDFYFDKFLV